MIALSGLARTQAAAAVYNLTEAVVALATARTALRHWQADHKVCVVVCACLKSRSGGGGSDAHALPRCTKE